MRAPHVRLTRIIEDHPTRRDALLGLAATPLASTKRASGAAAWSAGRAQRPAGNAWHPHYLRIATLQRQHPTEDDIVVGRMRRAGAITIGKTNTPEFGAGSQTFNKVFGATRNPYDLTKTCGGSSGGAAVALACGLVPVASGSDTGGSLRNPAAFCNVVGFRPSIGRVPNPKAVFAWLTLSTSGAWGVPWPTSPSR